MFQHLHGAIETNGGVDFGVWAPALDRVELLIEGAEPQVMIREPEGGFHRLSVVDAGPGTRYRFRLPDGSESPDPASRSQPEGIYGPSEVVAARPGSSGAWGVGARGGAEGGAEGAWRGVPLDHYIIYELHIGTFTAEGTFDGAIAQLPRLRNLGVTAIEIMPVAQFPGARNWGYDGVFPFAAQNTYGGPEGLRRLVRAIHDAGMAAILDVVYNHLGPEGNALPRFGPYLSERHQTLWGRALNFDGPGSDMVRRYFIENALWWLDDINFDALRLDAVHAIVDQSAQPFLAELAIHVDALRRRTGRHIHLIAESDLNDPRLVRPRELGGFALDAQWADDAQHALFALLTGERSGITGDFGSVADFARAWERPFVYDGRASAFRGRRHGAPAAGVPPRRFIVCAQNHDQIGNRMMGDRLTTLVGFEELKLAVAATLLSPYTPLIFMGEEIGETAPFPYFISHSDPDLIEATRAGRRAAFAAYAWRGEPPDPAAEKTFASARIDWDRPLNPKPRTTLGLFRELIRLRKDLGVVGEAPSEGPRRAWHDEAARMVMGFDRRDNADVLMAFNFSTAPGEAAFSPPPGLWTLRFDSADVQWSGPGSPLSARFESDGRPLRFPMSARACAVWSREK